MAAPGGSIGEADVRIVADTSRFREEVEAAIAAVGDAEVRVKPDLTGFRTAVNNMTKGLEASIRLKPLATGFRQKVNALTRGMEAPIRLNPLAAGFKTKVDALTRGMEAPVRLKPLATGFKAKVDALTRGMEAPIRLKPLATGFRQKVNALTRGMEAPIRLNPLAAGFRQKASAITREMEVPIRLKPNAVAFRAQIRALAAAMGEVTVRVRCRRIGPSACGESGLGALGGAGGVLGNRRRASPLTRLGIGLALGPFGSLVPILRSISNAFGQFWQRLQQGQGVIGAVTRGLSRIAAPIKQIKGPIAAFAVQLTAVGVAAGAAYQPIGALVQGVSGLISGLAGVPAALGILGAGFITISLAAGGMGEAISAALTRSDKDFARSISGLSQKQQQFAKQLRGFFKPLQEMASSNFFEGIQKGINALSGTGAGGAFKSGLDGASKAMGELANQAIRFFGTREGIRAIAQSFGGLRAIFAGVAGGMGKLLKGWSDAMNALLGNGGVKALQDAVQGMTERFGEWMSRAAASGKIASAWSTFVQTMKELFSITKSLVGVMDGLSSAMRAASGDGRGPLGQITDGLAGLDKWVNGAGAKPLITAFRELNEVGKAVWGTLKEIGSAYATYLGGVFTGGTGGSNPVAGLIEELGKGFEMIKPALGELGKAFGGIYEAVTPLVEPLAMIAKILVEDVAKFVQAALPGFKEFVSSLADTLGPALEALAPIMGELAEVGGKLVSDVFEALAPLLPPIGKMFEALFAAIEPLIDPVSEIVDQLGAGLVEAGKSLGPVLMELAGLFAEMMKVLGPLAAAILRLAVQILPPLVAIIVGVIGVVTQLVSWIVKLAAAVLRAAAAFLRWLKGTAPVAGAIGVLKGAISGLVGVLKSVVQWAGSAWDKIKGLASAAGGFLKGGWSKFKGLFSADGRIVYGPTPTITGEAGPEVIIPLTRPKRAAELAMQSGLMDVLARSGAASGGPAWGGARDVSVHVHTPSTSTDVLVHKMQRALTAALTA
ncbi:hypothetical protein ACFV42_23255 [Streptomyces solisilvae]|uniref:phage tail protein n=1 Tax=Streptomyces malaysiensis TaxID=92644 RepID=UPI0036809533